MDYSRYQVEDFVTDEYFIKWVKAPSEESNAFWAAWLSQNSQQKANVQEARQIILLLDIKENRPPEGKFLEIWENIIRDDQRVIEPASERSVNRKSKWYYQLAASLLFFLLVGASLFFYTQRSKTITTAYGESRTLFLPDSTKVTLNSNSSIRFSSENFNDKKREVWLTGEAFFAVVHKTNNQNFLVHTEQLNVEVLGTKFDVSTRRGKTRVVLEEGKVKLNLKSATAESIVMKPGELVEFSKERKNPIRSAVDPDNYSSWKNNRLVFVSTSLLEIGHLLEDNYGYSVDFTDNEIAGRKFTGSASSDNIQELLQKLSKVFNLDIQQENNKLIIQYKKETPSQHSPS